MAIHRDANNEGAQRTTGLFVIGPVTACGFFNFDNFTVQGVPLSFFLDSSNLINLNISTAGNVFLQTRIGGTTDFNTGNIAVSTAKWYFWACTLTATGTTSNLYVREVNALGALTVATPGAPPNSTFTPTSYRLAMQGVASAFRMAGHRVWQAVLTTEELERESRQLRARRRTNLRGEYPLIGKTLAEAYRDFGPDNITLTQGSAAPALIEGPPVPWQFNRRRRKIAYEVSSAPVIHTRIPKMQVVEDLRRSLIYANQ